MKTLCLDFGNTRMKAALYEGDRMVQTFPLASLRDLEAILQTHQPQRSVLSSVIAHEPEWEEVLGKATGFHKLTWQSKLPVTIPVGKPETVGADRLAIATAAVTRFPGSHLLAIGLGSCITYNYISAEGALMGGAISPGMEMRFRSMHEHTARLPLVKGHWNVPLIGWDTETNMQSGVVLGMAREIDGFIDMYRSRYAKFNALLTGGDTPLFEPHLKNLIFADPDLIFNGLYAISQLNALS